MHIHVYIYVRMEPHIHIMHQHPSLRSRESTGVPRAQQDTKFITKLWANTRGVKIKRRPRRKGMSPAEGIAVGVQLF